MSDRTAPWFKFYPADFMNGVRGMSAQEVGLYQMLLCRIYEENGPVEFNVLRLSTYCGMRETTFTKTVEKLIALGKLTLADGMLSNARAEIEISSRANDLKNASKAGKASAKKRQQNQGQDATGVQQPLNHTDTDTDTDKEVAVAYAREAENEDLTFRERLLVASGVDPVSGLTGHGGTALGNPADMAEAARWLALPGITEDLAERVVRDLRAKMSRPPKSFRYFTDAICDLSGQLTAEPLQPTAGQPARASPVEGPVRRTGIDFDLSKFDDYGNRTS